jgi:hypothetical protein
MPDWKPANLKAQFNSAQKKGWIDAFKGAGEKYSYPAALLMAIASRETNMQNIIGDGGHGYGIMQIDVRSFPDWCHSGVWHDAKAGIMKGALVLHTKQEQVRHSQGTKLKIGNTAFTGTANLAAADLLHISVAAYNSGLWAYYSFVKFSDPDRKTTGHDYSKDVFARQAHFETYLKSA